MTPLTPTQKAILEALAGGGTLKSLFSTRSARRVYLLNGRQVKAEDVMELEGIYIGTVWMRGADYIYDLLPLGRHALSDSGGGR